VSFNLRLRNLRHVAKVWQVVVMFNNRDGKRFDLAGPRAAPAERLPRYMRGSDSVAKAGVSKIH